MAELNHVWGADLAFGPTGDLALVGGADETVQRILRRLLTNLGDYISALDYGSGLGQFVGDPANELVIKGVVTEQMLLEDAVAQSPPPVVVIRADVGGYVFLTIQYADALTGQGQTLSFTVSA